MSLCPQRPSHKKRKMEEKIAVIIPTKQDGVHTGTPVITEDTTCKEASISGPSVIKSNRATSAPMITKEEMQRMGYRIVAEGTGVLSKRRVVIWSKKNGIHKRY